MTRGAWISDEVAARIRWCVGMLTGACVGFMVGAGRAGVSAHPWRTGIIFVVGLALLLLDWLVLDDDGGEDGPY